MERRVTMPKSSSSITETLKHLANSAESPKAIMSAVRKAHPDLKKKEVIRAAFSVMIELADRQPMTAKQMQDFAIAHRGTDPE
jgi:hypothetical protein